jgi:hypothetical protein
MGAHIFAFSNHFISVLLFYNCRNLLKSKSHYKYQNKLVEIVYHFTELDFFESPKIFETHFCLLLFRDEMAELKLSFYKKDLKILC